MRLASILGEVTTGAAGLSGSARFRYLIAGQFIVTVGGAIAPAALAFAILDSGGSLSSIGWVVACRALANTASLAFGGVLADRLPRHRLMFASCAVASAGQACVAVLVFAGSANILVFALLSALGGLAAGILLPASASVIVQLVAQSDLQRGNAVLRIAINGALVVGTAGGGLLVATAGPAYGLLVDAVASAVAAIVFLGIGRPDRDARSTEAQSFMSELRVGWSEFLSRRWLWRVVLGFFFVNMVNPGVVQVVGPAIADMTVGRRGWGIILAAQTVGMIVGASTAMRVRARHLLRYGLFFVPGIGIPLLVLAWSPSQVSLMFAFFFGGLALEQFTVAWDTTMQRLVPSRHLARVTAYDALGSYLGIPAGELAVGPLVDDVGRSGVLIGSATVVLIVVVVIVCHRDVWKLQV